MRVEGNTIDGRGIQVRGESSGVKLIGNTVSGQGLTIQPYNKGPRGKTVPRDITVSGGKISSSKPCVRLIEARSVRLEGAGLDCGTSLELNADSDLTAVNTLLRRVECKGAGVARVEQRVDVRFVDAAGAAVAGVEVVTSGGQVAGTSGADGAWKGTLSLETIRCPGPRRAGSSEVTLRVAAWSRQITARDLAGDVRVGG